MNYQIIQQPDGAYALWSSHTDSFVLIDAAPQDLVQYFLAHEERRLRTVVAEIVQQLANHGQPYHQCTLSWAEALERYEAMHGVPFELEVVRQRLDEFAAYRLEA